MNTFMITHFYHSGFSVESGKTLLVFDYWRGEEGELTEKLQLTPEFLGLYEHVYVFISHEHMDHMDPVVFTWKDLPGISYIVSSDMPVGTRGKRMAPGDHLEFSPEVSVTAFDSTDLGVSYLVNFKGVKFFHAGDLNFWHWREESTMMEIEEADTDFRKAVKPICQEKIDIAFFPLDPRQGSMFEAGANYFMMAVKPRIMIPMHYFHRADIATEYARTASDRNTEVLALPGYGDRLLVQEDEEGYLNLSFPENFREAMEKLQKTEEENTVQDPLMNEDDPFLESDLPLPQLAENDPEQTAGFFPGETGPEENRPGDSIP